MAKKMTHSDLTGNLRQRAEKQLKANTPEAGNYLTGIDQLRLLHELQVHQIELEMQNAELRKSQDDLAESQTKYQLAESQSLFKGIIDSTSDMIWSVDSGSFRLRSFNRSLSEYFLQVRNLRIEIGMGQEDLLPAEYTQMWRDFYRRALEKGSFSTEYATHTGLKTLQLNFNPLKVDGTAFGVSVFAKDITKRKRAE
jgi:PAS domain S-box-containing protein